MIRRFAVLAISAVVLAGCASPPQGSQATVASPSITPSISPEPTATASPTPQPSATTTVDDALPEFPRGRCCRGVELDPGTYRLPVRLDLDASLEVPAGWRVIREDEVSVFALVRGENVLGDVSDWLALFVLQGADGVVPFQETALGMEKFEVVAEPAAVTIAGLEGWRVDLQALPNPGFEGSPGSGIPPESQVVTVIQDTFTEGFAWTTASPEARVTFLTLQVNGRDVVIYVEAPQDSATAIDASIDILESLKPL